DVAACPLQGDVQPLQRDAHDTAPRCFGSSPSRSPSPATFTANTRPASASPGNTTIHQAPDGRYALPVRTSVPSEGEGGGLPTPRKDSVASVRIAFPSPMVAMTTMGPITLGSTCETRIAHQG